MNLRIGLTRLKINRGISLKMERWNSSVLEVQLRDAEDFAFDSFQAIRAGPDRAGWRTGPD